MDTAAGAILARWRAIRSAETQVNKLKQKVEQLKKEKVRIVRNIAAGRSIVSSRRLVMRYWKRENSNIANLARVSAAIEQHRESIRWYNERSAYYQKSVMDIELGGNDD